MINRSRIIIDSSCSGTRHLSKFWAKAGGIGAENEMSLDKVLNL